MPRKPAAKVSLIIHRGNLAVSKDGPVGMMNCHDEIVIVDDTAASASITASFTAHCSRGASARAITTRLAREPAKILQLWPKYTYGDNDPIDFIDPDGHMEPPISLIGFGVQAAARAAQDAGCSAIHWRHS